LKRTDYQSITKSYGSYNLAPDQRQISAGAAMPNAHSTKPEHNRRGINIYSPSQVFDLLSVDQNGNRQEVTIEYPFSYLSIDQRVQIFRVADPVFGIVAGRMRRIASIDFSVEKDRTEMDKMFDQVSSAYEVYGEFSGYQDAKYIVAAREIAANITKVVPDLLPDLSNFSSAFRRYRKHCKAQATSSADEIKEWMMEPNNGVTWEQYIQKVVFDLHIHGASATYKNNLDGRLENFDTLPGGTVFKQKNPYFGAGDCYVQNVPGFEPQLFYQNEVMYEDYLTTSYSNTPMLPLEALINKMIEYMLFDKLMADQADGTKPPNKAMIVTNPNNPFGDLEDNESVYPIDRAEQDRIQAKVNDPIKHGIVTLTGNRVTMVDLTREKTMETQNLRQKDIKEAVAVVYNASNMEMNLTGSDQTSGRQTAVVQLELATGMGLAPTMINIQQKMNTDIIPYRAGPSFKMKFDIGRDEMQQRQIDALALANGEITKNEIREREGKPVFEGEQYNLPQEAGGVTSLPGASSDTDEGEGGTL
jgi:hypothetical protein